MRLFQNSTIVNSFQAVHVVCSRFFSSYCVWTLDFRDTTSVTCTGKRYVWWGCIEWLFAGCAHIKPGSLMMSTFLWSFFRICLSLILANISALLPYFIGMVFTSGPYDSTEATVFETSCSVTDFGIVSMHVCTLWNLDAVIVGQHVVVSKGCCTQNLALW